MSMQNEKLRMERGHQGRRLLWLGMGSGLTAGLVAAACFGVAARPDAKSPQQSLTATKAGEAGGAAIRQAERLGEAFSQVAEQVSRAVVAIRVQQIARVPAAPFPFPFFDPFGGPLGRGDRYGVRRGTGSGVIIRPNGYILTNRHVVADADTVEVVLRDERRFEGKVVGTDSATDLAVVKIDATGLPTLSFASTEEVKVGQWVLAVGSPFGLDYTVTAGVVSAKGRALGANEIEDYVQTDASINPGNSGGPLVDLRGRIVGINTMIVGRGTGIGFAVPADFAKSVAAQIIDHGSVERAWIGVAFQDVTPDLAEQLRLPSADGALVSEVTSGSPAERAGIQPGDVIVALDGQPIRQGRDLLRKVLQRRVGEKVRLTVIRDGGRKQIELTLGKRPGGNSLQGAVQPLQGGGADLGSFGLQVRPLTPEVRRRVGVEHGVAVAWVRPGSPADRAGLRRGDVIVEADRQAVDAEADLARALGDGKALLRVRRHDGALFLVLRK